MINICMREKLAKSKKDKIEKQKNVLKKVKCFAS